MPSLKDLRAVFSLAALAVLCGCSGEHPERMFERSFFVMGTLCDIKVVCDSPGKAEQALRKIQSSLESGEKKYNFYGRESRLSFINREAQNGFVTLSDEEAFLINKSVQLSDLTGGAFDITFSPLWELWKKCEKEGRVPSGKEIVFAREHIGYKNIVFSPNGQSIKFALKGLNINLGGIAKGMALLDCKAAAADSGIDNLMVNLGGDILAVGKGRKEGWVVAVQDPFIPGKTAGRMTLNDKIALTSGIYQRYVVIGGRKYHHIIDARTGFPADDFASVTLVMNAGRRDYFPSLAVFLMGRIKAEEFLERNKQFDYFIIERGGKVEKRVSS